MTTYIPNGAQTYSKMPSRYGVGAPATVSHGYGAYLYSHPHGEQWLDCSAALGPVILGYCHRSVDDAVRDQIARGCNFSLPHYLEQEVADLLGTIYGAEAVRFGRNGADVCMAAVRLARAVTERNGIVTCGYHGSADWFQAGRSRGIPESYEWHQHDITPRELRFDIDHLEQLFSTDDIAGIMMEPVVSQDPILPPVDYLANVRALCEAHGVVLIFDEMVSAFRADAAGFQSAYDVMPDLTCLGKGMANGYALSALVGKRAILEELERGVFYSTTYAGECIGLAAAKATITEVLQDRVPITLAEVGSVFLETIHDALNDFDLNHRVEVYGYPQRVTVKWHDDDDGKLFMDAMAQQHVLWQGYLNTMAAHQTGDALPHLCEATRHAARCVANDRLPPKATTTHWRVV